MQNFELRLVIVILKLVTWMNRLDIWINNSNNSELGWISTSESWIIIKTKFFLWGSFRLECQKSLGVWFIRKKWLAQTRRALNINKFLKASAFAFSFGWFFLFFNDHFLLFIVASVGVNHKTSTEPDVLNKVAGVLKYTHDNIGAGVVERWK